MKDSSYAIFHVTYINVQFLYGNSIRIAAPPPIEKGCNTNLRIVLKFFLAIIGKFVLGIDKRCFLLHRDCRIMRATVFLSDFLSSRIIPQDTVVTRFGAVELSGAILTRHGTRKGKTRPN
jgi:hypothetical protein